MGKSFVYRGEAAHLKLPYPDFIDGKILYTEVKQHAYGRLAAKSQEGDRGFKHS